jgi:hypothetical protein
MEFLLLNRSARLIRVRGKRRIELNSTANIRNRPLLYPVGRPILAAYLSLPHGLERKGARV